MGSASAGENAQFAVYLGYAAPGGHALIDRAITAGDTSWRRFLLARAVSGCCADSSADRPGLGDRGLGRALNTGS